MFHARSSLVTLVVAGLLVGGSVSCGQSESFGTLSRAAEQGDAEAQWTLSARYGTGLDSPMQDDELAAFWLQKAAEQGLAGAQSDLGLYYDTGRGVPKDYVQAAEWFRKAADQGIWQAQSNLGEMYENGRGVPQDFVQAVAWYRKAAQQGWPSPQYDLAKMYENGRGVPRDYAEAYKWYSIATTEEGFYSGYMAESRDELAERMTPTQLAEGQQRARDWKAAFEQTEEFVRFQEAFNFD
jgi:TPR repeat protein